MQRLTQAASKEAHLLSKTNLDQTSQWDHTRTSDAIMDITSNARSNNKALVKELVEDGSVEMNSAEKSVLNRGTSDVASILQRQALAKKICHEEWVRRKDHEMQLREKLIIEAKRDLLETLVQKQEEEALRMQERSHQMYEWENKKVMEMQHKKLVQLQKVQKERLEKQQKQEISYMKFKEWLKTSLIKQREE